MSLSPVTTTVSRPAAEALRGERADHVVGLHAETWITGKRNASTIRRM